MAASMASMGAGVVCGASSSSSVDSGASSSGSVVWGSGTGVDVGRVIAAVVVGASFDASHSRPLPQRSPHASDARVVKSSPSAATPAANAAEKLEPAAIAGMSTPYSSTVTVRIAAVSSPPGATRSTS